MESPGVLGAGERQGGDGAEAAPYRLSIHAWVLSLPGGSHPRPRDFSSLGAACGFVPRTSRLGWQGRKGAPARASARAIGGGGAPPPARWFYLQQVRSQLLGDTVQGPGATRLSPCIS